MRAGISSNHDNGGALFVEIEIMHLRRLVLVVGLRLWLRHPVEHGAAD